MKTQMRFQRVLMLLTLIIAALSVVFALIYCSGIFNQLTQLKRAELDDVLDFIDVVQSANDTLLTLSIVFVVITLLPLIAGCQKRRNYYITNYIAIGIVIVFQIVFAILLIVIMLNTMQSYNSVDLEAAKEIYNEYMFYSEFGKFESYPWVITVGYVLVGLILVNAVALVLNLIWKIKLMKGEKALLNNSVVKEVA